MSSEPQSTGHATVSSPAAPGASSVPFDARDWGRKFVSTNGGCFYIDLDHLEVCLPETLDAFDHVACWQAMLRQVDAFRAAAQRRLSPDDALTVLANNSDGQGNSYGNHLNFMLDREVFVDLFDRNLHHLIWLASFQVSSTIFSGQGKVGSENGAAPVPFQLSQRGDFFERMSSWSTTHQRPLVNSRDEAHTGVATNLARLHCIYFDATLCPVATLLTVGTMQIVLTMLEAGCLDSQPILESPLHALRAWGHDPSLSMKTPCLSGARLTAVEHQLLIHEQAAAFVERGGCDGCVPRAAQIVRLWGEVLAQLKTGRFEPLVGSIDWITKKQLLEQAMTEDSSLNWTSPAMKMLDHLYSSVAPQGLFNTLNRAGLIRQVVDEPTIRGFMEEPPKNTRAWTRAHLLRAVEQDSWVDRIDWDTIAVECWDARSRRTLRRTLTMSDPTAYGEAAASQAFANARDLADLVERLQILHPQIDQRTTSYYYVAPSALATAAAHNAIPNPSISPQPILFEPG